MKKIKRVGVLSIAKFQAVMMATVGLAIGLMVYWVQALLLHTTTAEAPMAKLASAFGPLVIILFPVTYGILGFVMGTVGAALYNLIARWIGGIEIELRD
jgi:Transmembrane domain of unknown function (DUF3566)